MRVDAWMVPYPLICYKQHSFQDIIRYTVLGIAILLALIGYASTRQDVENFIDECEKDYPGDPGCDELRELYDNFLAPLVS